MLITIENFGAIKYFQFDTEKDLYLIFGKNSVGKSYAISLVYLILKNIIELRFSRSVKYEISYLLDINIKELEKKIAVDNDKEIDISAEIQRLLVLYLNDSLIRVLNDSLINTFNNLSNLQNSFIDDKLKVTIESHIISSNIIFTIVLGLDNRNENTIIYIKKFKINKQFILKKIKSNLNFEYAEKQVILYHSEDNKEHSIGINFKVFTIINSLVSSFFDEPNIIHNVYYLPASRSGLNQALSAFSQIFVELSTKRSFISKSINIPAIPEPTADYFLYLSNINLSDELHNHFIDYASEIEKEVLQGVVEFDSNSKKLLFTPSETSMKLDLSATSSMVSEISPIVSYLKYILPTQLDSKPLVFIEEPEAHLHPETQVKLMAVFARLAKDNKIKLVMTSHSNYIFNKASNLVMDNKIDKEKFAAVLFEPTPEGSVARILETDEYGIEDENFIDTAESIYEERIALTNKLNG